MYLLQVLCEGVGLLSEAGGFAVRAAQRDRAWLVVRADSLDPSPLVPSVNRILALRSGSTCEVVGLLSVLSLAGLRAALDELPDLL